VRYACYVSHKLLDDSLLGSYDTVDRYEHMLILLYTRELTIVGGVVAAVDTICRELLMGPSFEAVFVVLSLGQSVILLVDVEEPASTGWEQQMAYNFVFGHSLASHELGLGLGMKLS
jgi:hypothetical protein